MKEESEEDSSYKSSQEDNQGPEIQKNSIIKSNDDVLMRTHKESMDVDQESHVDESLTNSMIVFSELHSEDQIQEPIGTQAIIRASAIQNNKAEQV